jgi:hypothetical protein
MSNDGAVDQFFKVLNDSTFTNHHNVDYLTGKVFCAEDASHKFPCVGITDHGPQYIGTANVAELFRQLFTTFPDLTLTPLHGAPRLESPAKYSPKTIGVQTTLTGRHHAKWFPPGHQFFSPPLSNIHPDKVHTMAIPACAIFSIDDHDRISSLALYLDRYRMMQQLTPHDAKNASLADATTVSAQGRRITISIDVG